MGFIGATKKGFTHILTFQGRSSRSEYWYFALFVGLANATIVFVFSIYGEVLESAYYNNDITIERIKDHIKFSGLLHLYAIVILVTAQIAVLTRRLHDVGWSGLWILPNALLGVLLVIGQLSIIGVLDDIEGLLAGYSEAFTIIIPLVFISGLGSSVLCFVLALLPSSAGDNRYGPNPHRSTQPPPLGSASKDQKEQVKTINMIPESAAPNKEQLRTFNTMPETAPSRHAKALKVIEYSAEAAEAWQKVSELDETFQENFLEALDAEPTQDTGELAIKLIEAHQRRLRPYESDAANEALAQARTISPEAETEFVEVYDLLGRPDGVDEILNKIETRFGPSKRTLDEREKRERDNEWITLERRRRRVEQEEIKQLELEKSQDQADRRISNVLLASLAILIALLFMGFFRGVTV